MTQYSLHADLAILGPLGDIIPLLVDLARRHEFDDDCRRLSLFRITPQPGPDRTVRPPAVLLAFDCLLVQRQVQRRSLGMPS